MDEYYGEKVETVLRRTQVVLEKHQANILDIADHCIRGKDCGPSLINTASSLAEIAEVITDLIDLNMEAINNQKDFLEELEKLVIKR